MNVFTLLQSEEQLNQLQYLLKYFVLSYYCKVNNNTDKWIGSHLNSSSNEKKRGLNLVSINR